MRERMWNGLIVLWVCCIIGAVVLHYAGFGNTHEAGAAMQAAPFAEVDGIVPDVKGMVPDVKVYAAYIRSVNHKVFPQLSEYIAEGVLAASEEFAIPPMYLLALAQVESTFQYDAISDASCVGLTQINPDVWLKKDHEQSLLKAGIVNSKNDLFEPKTNLRAGAYVLSTYLGSENGQLERALARYLGAKNKRYHEKFIMAVGKFSLYKETTENIL